MKTLLILILVAALAFGAVFVVTGNKETAALAGDWYISLDLSEQLQDNVSFLKDVPLKDISVPYVLRIYENGTYSFELDEEHFADAMHQLRLDVGSAMADSIEEKGISAVEEFLAGLGIEVKLASVIHSYDISLDQLMELIFQLTGSSYDELLKRSLGDDMLEELFSSIHFSGNHYAVFGLMFFSGSANERIDLRNHYQYQMEDDRLTIAEGSLSHELLPVAFHR